jgi:hypothetical protein
VRISELAGVSPITAAIGLKAAYPFPAATRIVDHARERIYACTSDDAAFLIGRERPWWEESEHVERIGGAVTEETFGNFTLSALHFDPENAPGVQRQEADAQSILRDVLSAFPPEYRKRAHSVFSGIVGYANALPAAKVSPATMLQALRQRFLRQEEFAEARSHPKFDAYLNAKAAELFASPPSKKRGG